MLAVAKLIKSSNPKVFIFKLLALYYFIALAFLSVNIDVRTKKCIIEAPNVNTIYKVVYL